MNTLILNSDISISISKNIENKLEITYNDNFYQDTRLLGILHNGKWEFPNIESRQKLFELSKKYPKKIKRFIRNFYEETEITQAYKTINCLGRRFKIKIKKIIR